MDENRVRLPQPIGRLLSMLPVYPGSMLFAAALNLALRNSLPIDVKRSLDGKRLCIKVIDAQLAFHFQWAKGGFSASAVNDKPDLLIAASAQDFLLLARRQEDPDTLFFSRRLIMEGETDLGLLVKNTLDAIDMPVFDPRHFEPARLLAQLSARLKSERP